MVKENFYSDLFALVYNDEKARKIVRGYDNGFLLLEECLEKLAERKNEIDIENAKKEYMCI